MPRDRRGVTFQLIAMPFASYSEILRSRRLRAQMTDAENVLWFRLRGKRASGHRFRRQVPLGPYIVDFVCIQAQLIVEVDGSQHLNSKEDEGTAWLESRNFRVLRFWDNDVLQQTNSVLETIRLALLQAPTLPSPRGGGNVMKAGPPRHGSSDGHSTVSKSSEQGGPNI